MHFGPIEFGHWAIALSLTGLLFVAVFVGLCFVIFLLPIIRIVRRTGHSGWWALLVLVPLANIIALQILAYGRWPAINEEQI